MDTATLECYNASFAKFAIELLLVRLYDSQGQEPLLEGFSSSSLGSFFFCLPNEKNDANFFIASSSSST